MPAASDVSSEAVWSTPFPDREAERQADRNAELGIPSLPLATITSSSFGVQSGGPKELSLAFTNALDQLTNAMYRSADALDSSRSGSSSRPSWDKAAPLPMPVQESGASSEADLAYRAPFSNYAGLK